MSWFLFVLVGCWKDFSSLPVLEELAQPFDNPNLLPELQGKVFVSQFKLDILCPDGEPASLYTVYPDGLEGPRPVTMVFHSGAVSYQTPFLQTQEELPERLTAGWAENKIWETLGMSRTPRDLSEQNDGSLPTALANAGIVQIYPTNCWGDYWHNESDISLGGLEDDETEDALAGEIETDTGDETSTEDETEPSSEPSAEFDEDSVPNAWEDEGFVRQGRNMARRALRLVTDPSYANEYGYLIPQELDIDPSAPEISWIGLGDGGRAIIELMLLGHQPAGLLLDSVPMDIAPYLQAPEAFPLESGTLKKVFVDSDYEPLSAEELSQWSWLQIRESLPSTTGMIWSNGDSRIPRSSIEEAANLLSEDGYWVHDTNTIGHVFLNQDFAFATDAVEYLTTGSISSGTEDDDTSSGDTGASSGDTGASSGDTGASSGDTGASSGDTGASSGDTGASSGDSGGAGDTSTGSD